MLHTKFYIHYELGVHHLDIETTFEDFYQVISHLRKEFEIITDSYQNEFDTTNTTYSIINYYGDKQMIGFTIDVEV